MYRPVTVAIIGSVIIVWKGITAVEEIKVYAHYLFHTYRQLSYGQIFKQKTTIWRKHEIWLTLLLLLLLSLQPYM